MKLHHVGIACKDLEAEAEKVAAIHSVIAKSPLVHDEQQNATLMLLTLADGARLELVSGPSVDVFLKKKITYYHLCFEVADIHAEIERLLQDNALLLSPPTPAPLFEGRQVAFLQVSYGTIELLSEK